MQEQETRFWQHFLTLAKQIFSERTFELFILEAKFLGIQNQEALIQLTDIHRKLWETWEDKILSILLIAGNEVYGYDITAKYLSMEDENDEFLDQTISPNIDALPKKTVIDNLSHRYTFDNFVKGEGNRWSLAAAMAVAESPGTAYNPLFIWGGPGLGKTHLLNAIGNHILDNTPSAKVKYITTDEFVTQYVNSTRNKTMDELKEEFRQLDVLLIDDVQSLNNKTATQEEFFNTFNALHANNKQIVLTSDRAPDQLNDLEKRLVTRFEWGLIQQITPPDYETRVAILLEKVQKFNYDFQYEAIEYLANQLDSNVRELEGALKNINLIVSAKGIETVTIDIVAEALRSIKPSDIKVTVIPIEDIQEEVAKFYGVTVKDIKGTKRVQNIAFARQVAMYLTRELTDYSLPKIGKEFGGRDHSTVLHSYNKIKHLLEEDSNQRIDIEAIKTKLR